MYSMLLVTLFAASALGAQCPPEGSPWFLIPHETDCSKFYICAHGIPVLQTCPDGTHFSPSFMVCQNPVFAGCNSTLPAPCSAWNMLPQPHPDCSKFLVCVHGSIEVFDCPAGLEFNAELLECVWPAESNCNISQALPEDPETDASEGTVENGAQQDGGSQDGGSHNGGCKQGALSPHQDCSKYYICDHGVEIARDCPAGLLWNAELSFCDWPASAGCNK